MAILWQVRDPTSECTTTAWRGFFTTSMLTCVQAAVAHQVGNLIKLRGKVFQHQGIPVDLHASGDVLQVWSPAEAGFCNRGRGGGGRGVGRAAAPLLLACRLGRF